MGACSSSRRLLLYAAVITTLFALSYHYVLLDSANRSFLQANEVDTKPCSKAPEGYALVGAYGRVTTSNLILSKSFRAEILFSQGMAHAFAFNQIEGYRNFETALMYDNQCSMCYWGMALMSGPNLNADLDEEHFLRGRAAIKSAIQIQNAQQTKTKTANHSSPYVRKSTELMMYQDKANDLIAALKLRYPDSLDEWKAKGFIFYERLYADAMQKVHEKYPLDDDITGMYAEAVMNLSPWNVFEKNISSEEIVMNENSRRAFSILSKAIFPKETSKLSIEKINQLGTRSDCSDHPLLLHLWIHLLESGPPQYVQAAERQADLLLNVAVEPTGRRLGHLLHMPAHIYDNVGRYDDCISASQLAIASDRAYLSSCFTPAYDIHNQDVLVACAVMGGRLADALTYAIPGGTLLSEALAASAMSTSAMRPYHYTLATEFIASHFGEWDTILNAQRTSSASRSVYSDIDLALTTPTSSQLDTYANSNAFLLATILYGRCLALIGKGDFFRGQKALDLLKQATSGIEKPEGAMGTNDYDYRRDVGSLLVYVASASLHIANGKEDEAIIALRSGVDLQSKFGYREPTPFYLPLKQCLAAALVHHSKHQGDTEAVIASRAEAQKLYREDLVEHPHNVWSIRGQKNLGSMSEAWDAKPTNSLNDGSGEALRGFSSCCEIGLC